MDTVIPEPLGGAHRDVAGAVENLKAQLLTWMEELDELSTEELMEQRFQKFRGMGRPLGVE